MEPVIPIIPNVQHYQWGDDNFIPSLLGLERDGRPWAELWFGTHPGGESKLPDGIPLGDFLDDHAPELLGHCIVSRYGKDLPFLLKVLSIEHPFSLQVHPSAEQARDGYAKEVSRHVDTERGMWNYKDDRQKAEVFYALNPVTALCGFLAPRRIREHLMEFAPFSLGMLFPFLSEDSGASEETQLQRFFTRLCALETTEREDLLSEVRGRLALSAESADRPSLGGMLHRLLARFPDDPAALAPLFLNTMYLEPGEALYVEPRVLHTYLHGQGIELMSNSDNVLRAGLTEKMIDLPEVMRTVSFRVQEPVRCPKMVDATGCATILAPAEDFLLRSYAEGSYVMQDRSSVELLFCPEGSAMVICENSEFTIAKGPCVLIGSFVKSYRVRVEGTLFSVTVPACDT